MHLVCARQRVAGGHKARAYKEGNRSPVGHSKSAATAKPKLSFPVHIAAGIF